MDISFIGQFLVVSGVLYWFVVVTNRALYSYELEDRVARLEKITTTERKAELG